LELHVGERKDFIFPVLPLWGIFPTSLPDIQRCCQESRESGNEERKKLLLKMILPSADWLKAQLISNSIFSFGKEAYVWEYSGVQPPWFGFQRIFEGQS